MVRAASGPLRRGNPNIQQDDVGLWSTARSNCFVAVGRFGDDMELAFALEQEAEAAANQRMIVGNHYPDTRHRFNFRITFVKTKGLTATTVFPL